VKRSAGVLLYRRSGAALEVLLIHPGGPYWLRKDRGAWQLPKGEIGVGEEPEETARREVAEELGVALVGALQPLGEIRQTGGKWVTAYAIEQDFDPETLRSNEFEMEWPPRSGKRERFPEVSAARWLTLADARTVMLESQLPLLDRLEDALRRSG
jgi:predicted NUDIX family NTP pyrophosphohydrolase